MKIMVTMIEATAEDLRANRTVADAFCEAFGRIADVIARPAEPQEEEEENDGSD